MIENLQKPGITAEDDHSTFHAKKRDLKKQGQTEIGMHKPDN